MYINTISTLIYNWLLKNGCKESYEAKTSESKYLFYEDTKIRISRHLPSSASPNCIYIMIPTNNTHMFGVFIGKQYCSIPSLKDLKCFLKSIFLVLDIKAFNELSKLKIESNKLDNDKIIELRNKISKLEQENKEQKLKIERQRTDINVLNKKLANVK